MHSLVCILLFATQAYAKAPLPSLACPTYASVEEAESNCDGTFLMWGETEEAPHTTDDWWRDYGTVQIQSAFQQNTNHTGDQLTRANTGPYMCTSCNTDDPFGYVCPNYQCQEWHISYDFDRDTSLSFFSSQGKLPVCPSVSVLAGRAPSCLAIQRALCEDNGFGWLIRATSVNHIAGEYECSGCSGGILRATSSPMDPLHSPGMVIFYFTIALLFLLAVGLDIKTFQKHFADNGNTIPTLGLSYEEVREKEREATRQWWNDVMLQNLGLTNSRGRPMQLWMQIFKNYACSCEDSGQRKEFVAAFSLSWAVAVLSGGGERKAVTAACLFDGQGPMVEPDIYYSSFDAPIEDAYSYQFNENHFQHESEESDFSVAITFLNRAHLVPELLAIMYLFSVASLGNAVARIKNNKWQDMVYLVSMLACATFAVVLSVVARDKWGYAEMIVSWLAGSFFMFIILGPACAALCWLIGRALVCRGVLKLPPTARKPDDAGATTTSSSPSQNSSSSGGVVDVDVVLPPIGTAVAPHLQNGACNEQSSSGATIRVQTSAVPSTVKVVAASVPTVFIPDNTQNIHTGGDNSNNAQIRLPLNLGSCASNSCSADAPAAIHGPTNGTSSGHDRVLRVKTLATPATRDLPTATVLQPVAIPTVYPIEFCPAAAIAVVDSSNTAFDVEEATLPNHRPRDKPCTRGE